MNWADFFMGAATAVGTVAGLAGVVAAVKRIKPPADRSAYEAAAERARKARVNVPPNP